MTDTEDAVTTFDRWQAVSIVIPAGSLSCDMVMPRSGSSKANPRRDGLKGGFRQMGKAARKAQKKAR